MIEVPSSTFMKSNHTNQNSKCIRYSENAFPADGCYNRHQTCKQRKNEYQSSNYQKVGKAFLNPFDHSEKVYGKRPSNHSYA